MTGSDTSFPVACAEDIELSYRMSARGWKMRFAPGAIVYHTHPETFFSYLKKKYKFAFWRVLAVRKNPSKGLKDSHAPQVMKLQLLFPPALVLALGFELAVRAALHVLCFDENIEIANMPHRNIAEKAQGQGDSLKRQQVDAFRLKGSVQPCQLSSVG
jgi:GT2 family glycosyltransferase